MANVKRLSHPAGVNEHVSSSSSRLVQGLPANASYAKRHQWEFSPRSVTDRRQKKTT
jgi:hypothetical protein